MAGQGRGLYRWDARKNGDRRQPVRTNGIKRSGLAAFAPKCTARTLFPGGRIRCQAVSTSYRCSPRDARHWCLPLKAARFDKSVGIEVVELHENGATMRLSVRDEHLNVAGVVHGGVTFSLADSALGYGISKVVGRPCTTAEMKINFLTPVAAGVMIARSRIVRKGRRLVVARAEVHCGDTQVAVAQSTFAILD